MNPGDIIERNSVKYRVSEDGTLVAIEEVLTKRFDTGEGEMTSGVRRAMEQHASQPG
jgi:hypothetical protein